MNYILVGCKFKNNDTEYVFKCFDPVNKGDMVVVDTKLGFNLAVVTRFDPHIEKCPLGELREVVQVVDMHNFNGRQVKREKIEELKKKMDRKVKELQDLAVYELLAEKDPELQDWLAEFKKLI